MRSCLRRRIFRTSSTARSEMSCWNPVPTKILLPNAEAVNPASRQFYESIGLNEREIEMVQKSIPKRHYYVVSPIGRRMIALGLGGVALSFVGVSGREERQTLEGVIERHGDDWPAEWLRMRGLPDWAAYLEENLQKAEVLYESQTSSDAAGAFALPG